MDEGKWDFEEVRRLNHTSVRMKWKSWGWHRIDLDRKGERDRGDAALLKVYLRLSKLSLRHMNRRGTMCKA